MELAFESASSAEMSALQPGSSTNPQRREARWGSRASVAVLARLRDQADFLSTSRVPLGTLYLLGPGPGACLPRCCPRRRPISAGTWGPRHASPLLPRGAQLDSGQRAKVGGRTPLCLLSPRGLCPSNSRFLKEPRPGRLAVPDYFASILSFLGTSPESLSVP